MHEERPSHRHRHRIIAGDDLVFIRRLIAEHPGSSRLALSKKLCQAWNWVLPNGALRDMVCRSLMLKLHREGHIELPPVRFVPHNPLAQRAAPALVPVNQAPAADEPGRPQRAAQEATLGKMVLHVQSRRTGRIKREAKAPGHVDEIEGTAWRWGAQAGGAMNGMAAMGRSPCTYRALTIHKRIDTATTALR